jgi:predicted nucleic acid-binding protein
LEQEYLAQVRPSSSAEDAKSAPDPHLDIRLVDTSVWIRADRRKQNEFRDRLKALVIAGSAYICWPIRVELLMGAKDEEKFQALDEQFSTMRHLSMTDQTWRESAGIGRKLARTGQTVPVVDLLIAAAAIEAGMTLWTVDSDFKRVEAASGLRVDWYGLT